MRKFRLLLSIVFLLSAGISFGQTVIRGIIKNADTREGIAAVSVTVKNSPEGAYSDDRGRFQFITHSKFPMTIIISSIGFTSKEIEIQA